MGEHLKKCNNYVRDKNLTLKFSESISDRDVLTGSVQSSIEILVASKNARPVVSSYPSLKYFEYFAQIGYLRSQNQPENTEIAEETVSKKYTPSGFVLLAVSRRPSNSAGDYVGVAYVNKQKRQIIVSHGNKYLSSDSACSAMTFAFEVVKLIQKLEGWSVFFTGYLEGGWLAQVTCFSTIFLTMREDTHFIPNQKPTGICPYTVVFQAPPAADFLEEMKSNIFASEYSATVRPNWYLPIEVFLLQNDSLLECWSMETNYGTPFLLNSKTRRINSSSDIITKIETLLSTHNESDTLAGEVSLETRSRSPNKATSVSTIPKSPNRFLVKRFLNSEQTHFLKRARFCNIEGQFEGINSEDEVVSNKIVHKFPWTLNVRENDSEIELDCIEMSRQQFIPRIKHTVNCLQNGRIWWNPSKIQLPKGFIERIWRTTNTEPSIPYSKYFTAKDLAEQIDDKLILLVDIPGAGKSVALNELELILRSTKRTSRIICRINKNDVQKNLKNIQHGESCSVSHVVSTLLPFMFENNFFKENVQCVKAYLLFDGFDRVSPQNQDKIIEVIRVLLDSKGEKEHSCLTVSGIVLASRPASAKKIFDNKLPVKTFCLRPLTFLQQAEFLCGTTKSDRCVEDLQATLSDMPFLKELLSNPLLLKTYGQFTQTNRVLNSDLIMTLYLQFVEALHYLCFKGMGGTTALDAFARKRAAVSVNVNLQSYSYFAVNNCFGHQTVKEKFSSSIQSVLRKQLDPEFIQELFKFGVLVENDNGDADFTYQTFKQFFLMKLFLDEGKPECLLNNLSELVVKWESRQSLDLIKYILKNEDGFLKAILKATSKRELAPLDNASQNSAACENPAGKSSGLAAEYPDKTDENKIAYDTMPGQFFKGKKIYKKKEFASTNWRALTEFTTISPVLVARLHKEQLISQTEFDLLKESSEPNITKAEYLYLNIVKKWNLHQLQEFENTLKLTENELAFLIIESDQGGFILTEMQVEILKQQREIQEDYCYEGLSYFDEELANKIIWYAKGCRRLKTTEIYLDVVQQSQHFIPLVGHFEQTLKNEKIWLTLHKPKLPIDFIQRENVLLTDRLKVEKEVKLELELRSLTKMTEELVLLVGPSGVGKSTEILSLKKRVRELILSDRVIIHVNLNEAQQILPTISFSERAPNVLLKLAPYIPLQVLEIPDVRLLVLLDGFDEICPKYQNTMLNLLQILKPKNQPNYTTVILSTRPHLKVPLKEKFIVKSWTLCPLSIAEQNIYMESHLNVASEKLISIRRTFPECLKSLLINPAMLVMIVNILKTRESLSAIDVCGLYTSFVDSKHKLQLVDKEKKRTEDNWTEMQMKFLLIRNLPYYHRLAIQELTNKFESVALNCKNVAQEDPSELTKAELLHIGLVVEDCSNNLVFQHKSFAEFFYSKILLQPEIRQEARDILFGHIYLGNKAVLKCVEEFVAAALSNKTVEPNLRLSTKCLYSVRNCEITNDFLVNFARGKLFPSFVKQVLLWFVNGNRTHLKFAFRFLLQVRNRNAFFKLYEWMNQNKDWSRENLFRREDTPNFKYSTSVARLIVAIGIQFEFQTLLSTKELSNALKSCNSLLYIITSIQNSNINKWEFVGEQSGGEIKFRKLFATSKCEELRMMIFEMDAMWKLFSECSKNELLSFVSKEETRRTDAVLLHPLQVQISLGEDFLPNPPRLTEMKTKFDCNKEENIFEHTSWEFALDYVWNDLAEEMKMQKPASVTLAVRRSIENNWALDILRKLEEKTKRHMKCSIDNTDTNLVEWVVECDHHWDRGTSYSLDLLPFVTRYSRSDKYVKNIIQQNEGKVDKKWKSMELLKSLILSTHHDDSLCYLHIFTFLKDNLNSFPMNLKPLAELILGAKQEDIKNTFIFNASLLVCNVSVGQTFLGLIKDSTTNVDMNPTTLAEVVSDVIKSTSCCDLPTTLNIIYEEISHQKLRVVLLSNDVLSAWKERFSSQNKRKGKFECGLRSLLSFYFQIFGLNLKWMETSFHPYLLKGLPVEILKTLVETPEWTQLVPQFTKLVNGFLLGYNSVNEVAELFYRREWEWEMILEMIGKEAQQPGKQLKTDIPSAVAAPLIRTLVRKFGVDDAKKRVSTLWKQIPLSLGNNCDSLEAAGSLLHSAIELGELEEVGKRTWPGLLIWRNSEGKNALNVATEKFEVDHPITIHLQRHFSILGSKQGSRFYRRKMSKET